MIKRSKRQRRSIGVLAALALLGALLAGCASGSMSDRDAASPAYSGGGARGSGNVDALKAQAAMDDGGGAWGESGDTLPGGMMPTAASVHQDKIIYSASVTMKVDDVQETSARLRELIQLAGGYILQFDDTRHEGNIGANYVAKIPAEGFMPLLDQLSALPNERFAQSVSGKDVSEEYVDLESRLRAQEIVEGRLLDMMGKATRVEDLLQFSNGLASVQEEIERMKGRIRYLDNNVAYSTLELHLYQSNQTLASDRKGESYGAQLSDALTGSARGVAEALKKLLIVLAGALPVLAVMAIAAIPVWRVIVYRKRRRAASSSSSNQPSHTPNDND